VYKEAVTKQYVSEIEGNPYGSLATIAKFIEPNKRVLDVGCASGYLGKAFPSNEFYGIDGNTEAVQQAKKVYKDAITMDLNSIPTEKVFDVQFDYIVFADVLEHLLYPTELLAYFKLLLKPEGKIIVSLPNVALWRVRLNLLLGRFDYTDYGVLDRTHVHLYTFKSARELLASAGLTVTHATGAAYALGPLARLPSPIMELFSVHIIMVAA
jgi:2-polyprenyl-3-methyl-5-hydroxy-6-metoxy-1,4-benzoquinol methylase